MLKPLRPTVIAFFSGLFLSLLIPYISYGQACNGADGTGIYFGSVANVDNGTICANTPILPAVMEIDIRNVSELFGAVSYFIDWQDGSTQTVPATKIATSRFFASVAHTFPPNGGNVRCEYRPTVQIKYASVATPCAASLGVPPRFVRWNTDDQNTGRLEVNETVTGQNVYLVCAGVQTNVTFTDRSILNCVPPSLTIGQNDKMRWRRFEYGTANTITGTVKVGGTPHGYPYNGPVDASTEPTINSGFPTSTTQIITVPATAQVGEFFEITMDYWNTCNPYPARTPVSRTARILIVAQPPAPTSSNQIVCNGTTPSNFALGGVPGGNLVTWYRNVPGAPDGPGLQISQGTSTTLPVTSVPGYVNNTTAGVYKVWASYRPNVANALNCESPLIPITKTIREALTVPNPTTAPPQYICTGNSFAVGLTGPASTTVGGATEYLFGTTAGITLGSSTSNSATYDVAVVFAPGQLYVDKTITISRRYTPSNACQVDRNFTIRVYNNPVGGTPSNFPDVCEGTPIGPITLSGELGVIKRWEIQIGAGPWNTYAGPASGNSITPGVLPSGALGTTYRFRAIVGNPTTTGPTSYPCTDAISSVESVLVSPSPPIIVNAGLDQQFCDIYATTLTATDPFPGTGQWTYLSSVPAGRPSPGIASPNTFSTGLTITPGNEGKYTMRWTVTSGSCTFIDDMVVDFGKTLVLTPMTDFGVCGETATLPADPLPSGSGVWTCTGGACAQVTITNPTAYNTTVTLNGPAYTYGTYTFLWTVTNGTCVIIPDDVSVTFFEPIAITAVDFAGPCLSPTGGTTINLSGTFNTGAATSAWTVITGGGAITGNTVVGNTVTATYTSTTPDYIAGTPLTFRLTVNPLAPSVCAAETKDINVTIDRTPVVPLMTSISTCSNFAKLAADNPIPYGATGLWTGPAGITFDDATNPTTFARNLPAAPSSSTLTWTLTSGGGNLCTNFATVGVVRSIAPPSSPPIDLILCADPVPANPNTVSIRLADYEPTVTSLAVALRTIVWYQDAAPPSGIPVADPTITFTNVPDGKIYVARITETSTGCTSDVIVSINVRGIPTANHGTVPLCEDTPGSNTSSNVDLTDVDFKDAVTNGSNVVTWFHTVLGAQNNDPLDQITAPINVVAGVTVYARVSYSSGTLCVNVAPLDLSVKPLPTNTVILGRSTVCQGDPSIIDPNLLPVETYQVTPITGAKYFWNIPTGAGQFKEFGGGGISDFFVLLQFPNVVDPGIDITVRIELNGCSTPDIPLNIRVTPQPVKPIIAGPDIVCENDDGLFYNISPTNFPSSNYTWEIRKVSDNSLGGAFIKSGQGTDQVAVKYSSDRIYLSVKEVNSICVSDTAQYWVTVNRRPIMFDPNPDPEICSGTPINVVFAADGTSPVPIDRYDINLFSRQSATLNYVTPPAGPVFPSLGVAANAIQNHTFENLQAIPLSVKYNVTPISEQFAHVCPGQPVDLVIVIKPEPQLDPSLGRSICSQVETGITLLSAANTFPADRFVITSINVPAGVIPVSALPVADGTTLYMDDIILHNSFINNTGVNKTVQYNIAPYSTLLGCLGDPPTPINVVIYPQTTVDAVVIPPICNGDPLNVLFSSANNSDATFEWLVKTYDPNINVLSSGAGAGNITNMLIVNTSTTVDGTVTFEVRGKNPPAEESLGGCVNPPLTFVVTIKHSPIANAQNLSACSDTPGGNSYTADLTALEPFVNPDAGTPAVNLVWYKDAALTTIIPIPQITAYVITSGVPIYVEVEDASNGCKKVAAVQYTINPSIAAINTKSNYNGFNLNCNADNSGQIRIDITPGTGTPAFSYRLDGGPFINAGASTYTFNSLAAGNHTVDVQDSKGCAISQLINLVEPTPLVASVQIDNPITCFLGSDGQISTPHSGGTGTYASFLLLQTNTTNATGVFPNLTQGTYSVRVTDSNGCKIDTDPPVTLTQPTAIEINNVNVLTDANGFNLSCRDAVDGEVAVTFSGGNVPPNYTITMTKSSDPLNPLNINTPTSPATFTGLGFGNYSIIAKDAKGCPSLPGSAIIVNPPPFSPGFVGINQSICVGDDAEPIQQLVPSFGGVGNYQYQWQQSLTGSMLDVEWIDIPGATSITYDPAVLAQTIYFRRIAKSVSVRTGVACQELGKDNIVQVLINPLPSVIFSAPSEVCQGESFSLSVNMTGGTAPIEYDYSSGSTTFQNLIGTENTFVPISNFQAPQTYTLLRVKDLNGCLSPNVPQAIMVDIIKLNPDFQVLAPSEQCSGGTFTFQWVAEAGVKYTWIWSDGQQTIINPGDRPLGTNTITHVFTSGSTDASTIYPVRLQAENALCAPKFATRPVTVFPNIVLNILPGDPTLCSGESIRFIDQSNGVDVGKWYYHAIGSTDQLEIKAGPVPDITYTMNNITTSNPIDYEVVYEASNTEGCSAEYKLPVKVFRNILAVIGNNPDPPTPFTGGISTIEFVNNSNPLDAGDFDYTWDFGDARAQPAIGSGVDPITVDYFSAGIKDVRLTAVNIAAKAANKTCQSSVVKKILIDLPLLGAAFKATPLASCFPVNITVENLSPGADTFLWEVYNESGLVTTSNLRNPEFRILTPGVYDIYLTASYYATNQTATASQKGIEVYDVPTALFEMRPNPLYVPDTELQTFNQSARATLYQWDFDDGTTSNEFQPRHLYKLEGKYIITMIAGYDHGPKDIDGDGIIDGNVVCYDTVRNELIAREGGFVKLPNAFTPSPNGPNGGIAGSGTFNDVFLPIARGVEEFSMQVFDRWGNLVFESKDRNMGWDGYDRNHRLMPAGVYVYKLILRLSNGQRTTKIGDVTLIR
ncbi:MAG: gliding motility-associated C-terminal domain-containing protein [Chryseolinea sp.]